LLQIFAPISLTIEHSWPHLILNTPITYDYNLPHYYELTTLLPIDHTTIN